MEDLLVVANKIHKTKAALVKQQVSVSHCHPRFHTINGSNGCIGEIQDCLTREEWRLIKVGFA